MGGHAELLAAAAMRLPARGQDWSNPALVEVYELGRTVVGTELAYDFTAHVMRNVGRWRAEAETGEAMLAKAIASVHRSLQRHDPSRPEALPLDPESLDRRAAAHGQWTVDRPEDDPHGDDLAGYDELLGGYAQRAIGVVLHSDVLMWLAHGAAVAEPLLREAARAGAVDTLRALQATATAGHDTPHRLAPALRVELGEGYRASSLARVLVGTSTRRCAWQLTSLLYCATRPVPLDRLPGWVVGRWAADLTDLDPRRRGCRSRVRRRASERARDHLSQLTKPPVRLPCSRTPVPG